MDANPELLIEPLDPSRLTVGSAIAAVDGKWGVVVELLVSGLPMASTPRRAWIDFGTHVACLPLPGSVSAEYRMMVIPETEAETV